MPIPLGVPGTIPKLQQLLGTPTTSTTLAAAHLHLPSTKEDIFLRDLVAKVTRPKAVLSSLQKRRRAAEGATGPGVSPPAAAAMADTLLDNADKLGAFSIEGAVEMNTLHDVKEESEGGAQEREHSARGRPAPLLQGNPLEPSVIFATVTNAYEGMTCLDLNPSVTQMASGHRDSCVRVWRLNPNEEPHFGRLLKTAGSGGEWTMQEVLPKTKRMLHEAQRGAGNSSGVGSSTGGGSVNSGNSGRQSMSTKEKKMPMLELRGHSRAVYGVSQDCSPGSEDRLVVSCSADATVRLWDVAVSQCVGKYHCVSPAWSVAFSPLGYHFATGNQDHTASLYATDRVSPLRLFVGHTSDVNCVTWHGNAVLLATGSDDRTARLWDVRSSHCARLLRGCATPLSCTAISPLGNLLAAGTDNGKIYVWDLTTTRLLAVLQGHVGAVHSVAFSSDGVALSSGGADCSVRVWNLHDVIDTQIKLMPTASTGSGGGSGGIGASGSAKAAGNANLWSVAKTVAFDPPQLVLRSQSAFYTKFSPVFHVGYTAQNLLYAGGPFSLVAATGEFCFQCMVLGTVCFGARRCDVCVYCDFIAHFLDFVRVELVQVCIDLKENFCFFSPCSSPCSGQPRYQHQHSGGRCNCEVGRKHDGHHGTGHHIRVGHCPCHSLGALGGSVDGQIPGIWLVVKSHLSFVDGVKSRLFFYSQLSKTSKTHEIDGMNVVPTSHPAL